MSSSPVAIEPEAVPAASTGARATGPGAPLAPFLIGTAVGGLIGAVAGTLLANVTRRLLLWLIHFASRRLSDADRDRLRFEVLLQ